MKVFWLFAHPAPYKVNFFNLLGEKVDLTVVFERASESDRNRLFYEGSAKNYREIILKSAPFGHSNNYSPRAVRCLKSAAWDIIVINGWSSFTEMAAIRYLRRRGIPYVFAINGGIVKERENALLRRWKKRYISGAEWYLAPDARSGRYLEFYGAGKERIHFFPYATVNERQMAERPSDAESRRAAKRAANLPDGRLFVSVGSFIPRKNEMTLLRAWRAQPKEHTLLLIGDGPEECRYRRFIRANGLDNVRLVAYQKHDDILRYFRMADASLFLTNEDIYGHAVNESLSQGTPVIGSTRSNAANHLIVNGRNGFLLDPRDGLALAEALAAPITDAMRQAALATARENSLEKMAEAHWRFLSQIKQR